MPICIAAVDDDPIDHSLPLYLWSLIFHHHSRVLFIFQEPDLGNVDRFSRSHLQMSNDPEVRQRRMALLSRFSNRRRQRDVGSLDVELSGSTNYVRA